MRFRLLLLTLLLASHAFAAAPDFVPIAAARQKAVGEIVTVVGLVTVPPGQFRSSSGDEGFAIQDQTGGIWIAAKTDARLAMDQRVWVRGKLALASGKVQIVPDEVRPLQGRDLRVATGSVGKATLGWIVTVEGTVTRVVDDGEYGTKVFLDDGSGEAQVFVNKSADIDLRVQAGETIRVTGFGSQFDTTYEVEPRSRADIARVRR